MILHSVNHFGPDVKIGRATTSYFQMSTNVDTITTTTTQIPIFTIKCFIELKHLHSTIKSFNTSILRSSCLPQFLSSAISEFYMNVCRSWRTIRGRRWINEKKYCHFGPWPYHQSHVQLMPTKHVTCPQKTSHQFFCKVFFLRPILTSGPKWLMECIVGNYFVFFLQSGIKMTRNCILRD
jgi:hypothetical protein